MGDIKEFFIILTRDGVLKKRRSYASGSVYADKGTAINQARSDGDSVVAIRIDLGVEPIYIRRRTIKTEE